MINANLFCRILSTLKEINKSHVVSLHPVEDATLLCEVILTLEMPIPTLRRVFSSSQSNNSVYVRQFTLRDYFRMHVERIQAKIFLNKFRITWDGYTTPEFSYCRFKALSSTEFSLQDIRARQPRIPAVCESFGTVPQRTGGNLHFIAFGAEDLLIHGI